MKKPLILLIEDSLDNQRLISFALERENYVVETASTGEEAYARMKISPLPHLILMDLNVPGFVPDRFIQILREQPDSESVKVLLLSGMDDLKKRAAVIGVHGFIRKPFELNQFYKIIENTLEGSFT